MSSYRVSHVAVESLDQFDTGRRSLVHAMFSPLPGSTTSFFRYSFLPFVLIALVAYGGLLLIAVFTSTPLLHKTGDVIIPFFNDYNTMWMCVISLPFVVVLILTERQTIPENIKQVFVERVFSVDAKVVEQFFSDWQTRFESINIIGQLLGLAVGIGTVVANYLSLVYVEEGTVFATNGVVNLLGWYFLAFIFIFYFVVFHYVTRAIGTVMLLNKMVKLDGSKINIIPFHPDKCGGLSSIGSIALRNQYLLTVLGINIIFLVWFSIS